MSELFMIAPVSSKAMMANWMMMLPLTLLMFISSFALIWMVKASNEVQFEIRTHEIQIRYPFYGKTIAKKDLDLANARLIDLKNAVSGANPIQIRKSLEELDTASRDLAELQVNQALQSALSGKDVASLSKKT